MFDSHYDLLTYIYMKHKENNLDFIKKHCQNIYRPGNVEGGILNLFFMSEKEMENELNISPKELDVLTMLSTVDKIIKENNLLPIPSNFVYGIEGCDYIKYPKDLIPLYELGVRSINPVWNEPNKYGSGHRSSQGLTTLGRELIEVASSLRHFN